jgi:hypothetical protein
MAIGDRDKDYGAWCNDPLDIDKVNCIIEFDADNQLYIVRARWDIQQHEELFIDYGEEYWRESYWSNPSAVMSRHPGITPNNPAPAEGENSEVFETVELPEGAPKNLSTDIFKAKIKKWTQTKPNKIGVKAIRVAKTMAELFSRHSLSKVSRGEEERNCEEDINERVI